MQKKLEAKQKAEEERRQERVRQLIDHISKAKKIKLDEAMYVCFCSSCDVLVLHLPWVAVGGCV